MEDINEFAPMFTETEYTGSVFENRDPPVIVLVVCYNLLHCDMRVTSPPIRSMPMTQRYRIPFHMEL